MKKGYFELNWSLFEAIEKHQSFYQSIESTNSAVRENSQNSGGKFDNQKV